MSRIGKTVLYTLSEQDVKEIIERRRDIGNRVTRSNDPRPGDELAAVVVADWGGSVNLKVLLDGYGDHWATSRVELTEQLLDQRRAAAPGVPDEKLREFTWREISE
jgi:hypothetical protein